MKEEQRKTRLAKLIDRLNAGKDVANRDLRNMLTTAEYEQYVEQCKSTKEFADWRNDKPEAVSEYEALLKIGTLLHSRAEGYTHRDAKDSNGKRAAPAMYNRAEAAFERALERLQELAEFDPQLQDWFDRRLDFTVNGNLAPNPASMPRARTSASTENQLRGRRRELQHKRETKRQALQDALNALNEDRSANLAASGAINLEEITKLRKLLH